MTDLIDVKRGMIGVLLVYVLWGCLVFVRSVNLIFVDSGCYDMVQLDVSQADVQLVSYEGFA